MKKIIVSILVIFYLLSVNSCSCSCKDDKKVETSLTTTSIDSSVTSTSLTTTTTVSKTYTSISTINNVDKFIRLLDTYKYSSMEMEATFKSDEYDLTLVSRSVIAYKDNNYTINYYFEYLNDLNSEELVGTSSGTLNGSLESVIDELDGLGNSAAILEIVGLRLDSNLFIEPKITSSKVNNVFSASLNREKMHELYNLPIDSEYQFSATSNLDYTTLYNLTLAFSTQNFSNISLNIIFE